MKKLLCLLAVMFSVRFAATQTLGTGAYPFASFDNRGFDSINLGNLNMRFNIPIVSRTGRGMPFNYSIQYEGLIWQPVTSNGITMWKADDNWGFSGLLNGTTFSGYLSYNSTTTACRGADAAGQYTSTFAGYVYHDPYGANHNFNYQVTASCVDGSPQIMGTGASDDGSGYTLVSTGNQIMTRNGVLITPAYSATGQDNTSMVDSNGNKISSSGGNSFLDTLGVTALTIGGSNPRTLTYPVTLQPDPATTSASASISYSAYTVRTNFQCPSVPVEFPATTVDLVSSITLADGSSTYTFSYEPTPGFSGAVTGRLASITLPTGGVISYTYSGGCSNSGVNADGTTSSLTRTTTDGSKSYSRAIVNNNSTSTTVQTTVQDQTTNSPTYQFSVYQFSVDPTSPQVFYETHRKVYQGAATGTPLLEQATCYNIMTSCDGTAITLPISQMGTVVSYNGGTQTTTNSSYDSYGSLTGSTVTNGGTNLQSTVFTYNNFEEVLSATVSDGSGNQVSKTTYGYDETAVTSTHDLGIPQHNAVIGATGNQTSVHVTTGSGTLDTTTSYYDTGMPISTKAPGESTTSYTYDSTQAFVTTTSLPTPSSGVALSITASYDPQTTMPLSTTGMNAGQTTQITEYDRLLRPTAAALPNGSTITLSYSPNQNGVQQTMDSTSTSHTDTRTFFDAYGRTNRVAVLNGNTDPNSQWYVQDFCYDASGLLQFESTEYGASGGTVLSAMRQCTGNGTSYVYDALGRVTGTTTNDGTAINSYSSRAVKTTDVNGVQRITQYDLLGRISGVCEISSNPLAGQSPIPCSMDIANTNGYVTSYGYDLPNHKTTITQGGQIRTFQTDAAGRTTSVVEPERGTTTYSYTYNTTGLLVSRVRPQANQTNPSTTTTTTTQYDSLGRMTAVNYSDGTPAKNLLYDAAQPPWNEANQQQNMKGNLALHYRQYPSGSTATIYSYDANGNVTANWQCFPASCGRGISDTGIGYGYDLAGNLTYEGDGASGGISYGRSPAGEITSATNLNYTDQYNTPALVSNVVNTPFGPASYQLGNGLYTVNSYDSSGRKNGTWVCGGSASFGCGNGSTLYGNYVVYKGSQLTYTEDTNMEPGKAPVYDEFNRLVFLKYAQNGQTFSQYTYDRWGNRLSQSGSPSVSYSFDSATNRNTSFGYDAAGNQTNDVLHTYTYDADGNVTQVDNGNTALYVYDAMNHRTQVQTPSSTYEYAYDVAGRRMSSWLVTGNGLFGNEGRIWWDSGLLATRDWDGQTFFHNGDYLGTERMRTNYQGQIATSSTSGAFGDGFSQTSTDTYGAAQDNNEFAGQDSDFESGTAHAQFRQYAPTQGRWMSPDPYDGSYDASNPQSMNRYSYVLNNPLSLTDPDGEDTIVPCTIPGQQNCSSVTVTATPTSTAWGPSPGPGINIPWWILEYGSYVCGSQNGSAWVCPGQQTSAASTAAAPAAAPNNAPKPCTVGQRAQLLGNGLLNLGLAAGKITAAAGVEAGTSGIGTALALYGVYSASGNLTTGLLQTVGAFSSNPAQFQQAASVSSVAGSAAGLTTLVATNGNLAAASSAARFENFGLFGFKLGLGGSFNPLSATGTAVNAAKQIGVPVGCH